MTGRDDIPAAMAGIGGTVPRVGPDRREPPHDLPAGGAVNAAGGILSGGRGGLIATYTGRAFPIEDPHPADVRLDDIASALANLCRFGGHPKRFYSVAEHSVLVSRHVPARVALWGLLHDASEAYLGDVVRPLKRAAALTGYREIERRVQLAICKAMDLPPAEPETVTIVDKRISDWDEWDALMTMPPFWPRAAGGPVGATIEGWPPERAKAEFLARYAQLRGVRP